MIANSREDQVRFPCYLADPRTRAGEQLHGHEGLRGAGSDGGVGILECRLQEVNEAAQGQSCYSKFLESLLDPRERVSQNFGSLLLR